MIEEAMHIVANQNAFHPVRDFLNRLEWERVPNVNEGVSTSQAILQMTMEETIPF